MRHFKHFLCLNSTKVLVSLLYYSLITIFSLESSLKIKKKTTTQISIQQYSRQQLICVLDAEHDLKNSVFKVIGYFKYEFNFFFGPQISYWSVVDWLLVGAFGQWSVRCWLVVRWSDCRWSVLVGRLVGDFKETKLYVAYNHIFGTISLLVVCDLNLWCKCARFTRVLNITS